MSPSFTVIYAGSREIGQPGSYLAQASFRKFVCVRGSVSSVLRCVRGRNEYRNNVSIGMTRRSFYLLNLRRISRDGRGENGKAEERSEEAERKKKGEGGWETRRDVGVADDGDTIHRFRSTASIRIVRPLRPRRFRFTFPRRGRERQPLPSSLRMVHRMLNYD